MMRFTNDCILLSPYSVELVFINKYICLMFLFLQQYQFTLCRIMPCNF